MLPTEFQFSQKVLQSYIDCPRRFELQYLLKQPWPAVETQPIIELEHHLELGRNFHKMVQQYILGVPLEDMDLTAQDRQLVDWWQAFKDRGPQVDPDHCSTEVTLTTRIRGYQLLAQYDLIQIGKNDTLEIFDWKTTNISLSKVWLQKRLQTRVYLYVISNSCDLHLMKSITPECIKMRYWFPQHPEHVVLIQYSENQKKNDEEMLGSLIDEIVQHQEKYPLTDDSKQCKYCQYRSLCDRGIKAGDFQESMSSDEDVASEIDFDQITEIQF